MGKVVKDVKGSLFGGGYDEPIGMSNMLWLQKCAVFRKIMFLDTFPFAFLAERLATVPAELFACINPIWSHVWDS